jgi:phage shock protein A
MAESIGVRVKRVIAGTVNDLVDSLESANTDGVMREAIREIERTLDAVRSELGHAIAARAQASRHIERTKAKIAELGTKATFAVEQGRDDLAEAAIARQVDLERQIPVIEASHKDAAGKQSELESFVVALNGRKSEMEADLTAYTDARRSAGVNAPAGTTANVMQAAERRASGAEQAFNRAMNGPMGANAADAKSQRETAARLQELESIERSGMIASRLADVKARKGG